MTRSVKIVPIVRWEKPVEIVKVVYVGVDGLAQPSISVPSTMFSGGNR